MSGKIKKHFSGFSRLNKKIKKDWINLFYFLLVAGVLAVLMIYLPIILLNFTFNKINFFIEFNIIELAVVFAILFVFYLLVLSKALDRGWI